LADNLEVLKKYTEQGEQCQYFLNASAKYSTETLPDSEGYQ